MQILMLILRSFLGMMIFSLPARCVPQRVGSLSLMISVATLASILRLLTGDHLTVLMMLFMTAMVWSTVSGKDALTPSLYVSNLYLLAVSEIIVVSVMQLVLVVELEGIDQFVLLWQLIVMVIYCRIFYERNKMLLKEMQDGAGPIV